MRSEIDNCAEEASARSSRTGAGFAFVMVSQFALVQYGTYVAFSWDIMEPITCGMTLFDAILCYYFWLWTGKPWDVDGLRSHFYERALSKKLRKRNIDRELYD